MVKDVASSSPDYRQVTTITVFFYPVVYQNKTLLTSWYRCGTVVYRTVSYQYIMIQINEKAFLVNKDVHMYSY